MMRNNRSTKRLFKTVAVTLTSLLFCVTFTAVAQRQMERLNRGLVAVKVANGVFLSWRVFGTDSKDVAFNVYRDGTKVNTSPITGATNMVDAAGTTTASYSVKAIVDGVEQYEATNAVVWASQVKEITLEHRPSATHAPNDINVGDLDGDGQYELVVKWYPANAQDNANAGVTDNTFLAAYKLDGTFMWILDLGENIRSGAHYTQHLVADFDGDGKAEVICKTAPRTKDASGKYLSKGPAAAADTKIYRDATTGHVSAGPEYLTIFNGKTGLEMATTTFLVGMGVTDSWGKTGDNTNRVHRFNSTIAYLDGKKPSAVFNRGYYGRLTLSAWDWDGKTLSNRWIFNSSDAGNAAAAGQGNHNISCADVDADGFDELILGACAVDHNGTFMYATGLGHGDAMHLGNLDLDNPGLEVWVVHEGDKSEDLHDAKTGKILWRNGNFSDDNGRGLAADISTASAGYEMWSAKGAGTMSCKNSLITSTKPSMNFRVYWDGDLQDELLDSKPDNTDCRIDKWNGNGVTRLLTLTGLTCNGTKSTPNLSADILGDWREEVILHDGASTLYIHTTTISTTYKLYTLMHDPVYRNAISWQQSAYNQPPHLGFFLGNGVDKAPVPDISYVPMVFDVAAAITAPANQASYCSGSAVQISATATTTSGSIAKVDFFDGTLLLGSDNTAPYSYVWTTPTPGSHTIQVIASNTENKTSAPATVTLVVQATTPPPTVVASVEYTKNAVATALTATGTALKWYASQTATTALAAAPVPSTASVGSVTYFVSQTLNSCESQRASIPVTVTDDTTPAQPVALKAGWNLIGCPIVEPTDLAKALSSIWSAVEVVKNLDSFYSSSGNQALNSLKSVEWGQGYWVKVTADCVLIW